MFTICNSQWAVATVMVVFGDVAHLLMTDGKNEYVYLPSLEPEDREKILQEVNTQIITNSAAGPVSVRPEAGGVEQSFSRQSAQEPTVSSFALKRHSVGLGPATLPQQSNIKKEESMSHKQSDAQSVTIPAGTYTSENLSKEIAIGLHTEDGIKGETPKRTRTVRPRDPEAEAIATITDAELKRNERIDKAKVAFDTKVEDAEEVFRIAMKDTLSNLDEVTRARVGSWIELRYGKI